MKRTRALAGMTTLGLLAIAACGGEDGGGNTGPATEECPDGTVTLSVLRAERSNPTDEQIAAYKEKNECVKFKIDEVPFGQLTETIGVRATSNDPPDVLGFDGPDAQSFASQGILLPLDDYIPDGWHDDVIPATLDEHTWEDKVYSLGIQQDALALYYNKTMTDAAGIKNIPKTLEDAWTWEEARKAFEACQQGSGDDVKVWGLAPSRLGQGTPGFAYRDLLFLRSAGDPDAPEDSSAYRTYWALSKDGKEVDGWLNTPEAIDAATFYQELFTGPDAVTPATGIPNAMIDGKACFDLENTQMVTFLEEANVDFEWGVTPMPYFETPIVHTGAVTAGVSAASDNPDAAAEFVVGISTGDIAKQYTEEAIRPPVLQSVIEDSKVMNEFPYSIFTDEIQEWGKPRPPSPHFVQYNQYVTDALRDVAYGTDPKKALDQAVSQIQPILGSG